MLTLGSSHALHLACATRCGPGDTVFVETPHYEVLSGLPKLCGANVVLVERDAARGHRFAADLPQRIARELHVALPCVDLSRKGERREALAREEAQRFGALRPLLERFDLELLEHRKGEEVQLAVFKVR